MKCVLQCVTHFTVCVCERELCDIFRLELCFPSWNERATFLTNNIGIFENVVLHCRGIGCHLECAMEIRCLLM